MKKEMKTNMDKTNNEKTELKINLINMHSPCQNCYIHGHLYSSDDRCCQSCEYNIAIQILKEVLRQNDYCSLCKNVELIKGGYCNCKLGFDGWKNCNSYVIDWSAIIKEYQLQIIQ